MDCGIGSQEGSLPGEIYPEIVERLDEALLSFTGGRPFMLQRLCEILFAPKCIYPKLLKLALALQKSLLVTSTLKKCTDPYPVNGAQKLLEPWTANKQIQQSSHPVLGGVDSAVSDGDEELDEADANEDGTNRDPKVQEDKLSGDDESGTDPNQV